MPDKRKHNHSPVKIRVTIDPGHDKCGSHSSEVRPDKVELAKKLINDPDFPSDSLVEETARKIYTQYFEGKTGPSQ